MPPVLIWHTQHPLPHLLYSPILITLDFLWGAKIYQEIFLNPRLTVQPTYSGAPASNPRWTSSGSSSKLISWVTLARESPSLLDISARLMLCCSISFCHPRVLWRASPAGDKATICLDCDFKDALRGLRRFTNCLHSKVSTTKAVLQGYALGSHFKKALFIHLDRAFLLWGLGGWVEVWVLTRLHFKNDCVTHVFLHLVATCFV